jgi:alkanesulfonate monooxygenase SsuD/methylene tetrahydromethanopterin reductase-like flavin-dependent oxidoreductase (luciferase family)
MRMRYALNVPNFGAYADVRALATLARAAEDAGWDGFFLWDHIHTEPALPLADPWIELAAMALATERITLGTLVTPMPRRRPWKLARESVTLDRLSNGRLILGVGLGGEWMREYSAFGEPADDQTHAAMLDEGLDVLTGLWTGEPFSYTGKHYTVINARFLPTPQQSPRIPIWVAGVWPGKAPFRRAARWDGVCPIAHDHTPTPREIHDMLAYLRPYRTSDAPFEVAVTGFTGDKPPEEATKLLTEYADAGVTWWQEGFMWEDSLEDLRARIAKGPPTV